jgi:hypothetical protein
MQVEISDLRLTYSAKSDEELLSLHARGSLTEVAFEALESELRRRGLTVPTRPNPGSEADAAMAAYERMTLAAHWKGRASLASAYWLVGVIGFWVVYGALFLIAGNIRFLMPVATVAFIAYLVFAWVSIWRCAWNSSWWGWGYVARAQVVVFALVVTVVAIRLLWENGFIFSEVTQRSLLQ